MLTVTRTTDGLAYLHLWREGDEYLKQKGDKFLREWTNVRYVGVPTQPIDKVFDVDLSKEPLDFPDGTFDAANAYHVLEHLTPEEGDRVVRELARVLKPGAILRLSVPDLEDICREYLRQLERTLAEPTAQNVYRYQWNVMEIFDQMVRERSGGMMMEAIRNGTYDRDYLLEKYADVYRDFLVAVERPPSVAIHRRTPVIQRLLALTPGAVYEGLRWRLVAWWERYTGRKSPAKDPGNTKELVRWMYDRLSLGLLMRNAGFVDIQQKDFRSSGIAHWDRYDLDRSNHGDYAIDPSVYLEGRKPD